jgi:hypothetical protein
VVEAIWGVQISQESIIQIINADKQASGKLNNIYDNTKNDVNGLVDAIYEAKLPIMSVLRNALQSPINTVNWQIESWI